MPDLFSPLSQRGVTFRNRIGVSPMCQYSSQDGFSSDWHLVHLGSRAVGGAGVVFTEAAAVGPAGRISPQDLGIWMDDHVDGLTRITRFVRAQGATAGIQLAHAGRKASTAPPWEGRSAVDPEHGGWEPLAPSALAYDEGYLTPRALKAEEIHAVRDQSCDAARRSLDAGFQVLELHAAHGYLLHSFLSPLSNRRNDEYGGTFEGRTRLLLEVAEDVRRVWPEEQPLWVRISTTDWVEGGWTVDDSVELARRLRERGVDLIDCSSGGLDPRQEIPAGAGYQLPGARRVRREAKIPVAAVGMITEPMQADTIIRNQDADVVLMAREFLRSPYWPLHAAPVVHRAGEPGVPVQYERAYKR